MEPAAEAGERAVRADHAMARKDDRQRVLAVRRADGAGGVAAETEPARLLAVADGLSVRNRREREPAALLELGAVQFERQVERRRSPAKYASNCRAASARTGDSPPARIRPPSKSTACNPDSDATRPSGPIGLSTTVRAISRD